MDGLRTHVILEVEAHVRFSRLVDEGDQVAQVDDGLAVELLQLHVVQILVTQRRVARQNLHLCNNEWAYSKTRSRVKVSELMIESSTRPCPCQGSLPCQPLQRMMWYFDFATCARVDLRA